MAQFSNIIIIAGSSGLIGGLLTARLEGQSLTAIGRRAVPGMADQRIAPVAEWPALVATLAPDVAISVLGTTIRAAGSQDAFAAIDHDAVVAFARAAKDAGARQFIMVSSVGAGGASFYLKTKGRAEASVRAMGFARVDIFRPGLLLGERAGDARPVERLFAVLSPLTNALTPRAFDHYRAIAAEDVAAAMAAVVGAGEDGVFIHHNREMLALARVRP
jgi:nucleoside-diphosphate-sugar epimerase